MNALTPVEAEEAVEAAVPSGGERLQWVTRRGERLFLDEMDRSHLENTYRMIFRNVNMDHPGAALLAVQVLEAELRRRGVRPEECIIRRPSYMQEGGCDCHPSRNALQTALMSARRPRSYYG